MAKQKTAASADNWDKQAAAAVGAPAPDALPDGVKAFPGAIDGTGTGDHGQPPGMVAHPRQAARPDAGPRAEGTPTSNPPTAPKGPTDADLEKLIKEVSATCGKLEAERKRINAAIKEQHQKLTAAGGFSQRSIKLVLKLEGMEDPDRELFDRSFLRMRRVLGHPVQGELFGAPRTEPTAEALRMEAAELLEQAAAMDQQQAEGERNPAA